MDIRASVHAVLRHNEVLADLFYPLFLGRCPEARPLFGGADLPRQAVLLTTALLLVEGFYGHAYPSVGAYLEYLGSAHRRRGVAPELYPKFRDALLETLEQFHGPDWGPVLAGQWRKALDLAADTMLEGYRERHAV